MLRVAKYKLRILLTPIKLKSLMTKRLMIFDIKYK